MNFFKDENGKINVDNIVSFSIFTLFLIIYFLLLIIYRKDNIDLSFKVLAFFLLLAPTAVINGLYYAIVKPMI